MKDKRVRECQNCHGNTRVYVENPPGKWTWKKCGTCNGTGRTNVGTI
jgi:DnaJ-class molecular chaperone